jgi:predicted DNA-binding protein
MELFGYNMEFNGVQGFQRSSTASAWTAFGLLPESVKLLAMPKKARPMPFSLRMRPELRKRLEALARADNRTLTNYLMVVLERHAEDAERKRKAETERLDK